MGNTGKPSRGCTTCKKRKIKCDQVKPACSQCRRSGWTCPGFSSEIDVVFRNQTATDIERKNGRQGWAMTARLADSKPSSASKPSSTLGARTQTVSPPVIDRATNFFIQHYVLTIDSGSSLAPLRGNHEYLPGLLQSENSAYGVLSTTVAAAGLAALANAGNATAWRAEAFRLYGKAICQLQRALQDPVQRISDQTLAAVMLMGIFETIASADVSSMKSFSHHTIAAARCIEMRGPAQFRSVAAVKLFTQIRRMIVMTSHQLQEPIPYQLSKWSQWAERLQFDELAPANRFAEINEILARARADLKHKFVTDPAIVSAKLLPADEMLENWERTLPESWAYKPYRSVGPHGFPCRKHDMQCDIYPDPWIACVWNSYRNVRLLIHESIITATLKYGSEEQKANLQSSAKILVEMADGICHSAAYHLGHEWCDGETEASKKVRHSENVPTPGGFLLLWPLFFSGMLRTTPTEQRQWIAKTIRQMGIRMGLQLAMSMAKILEEQGLLFSHSDTFFLGEWYPN